MIPVKQISSRAVRSLGIHGLTEYDENDILAMLQEVLIELQIDAVAVTTDVSVTTVEDQGEYAVTEDAAIIDRVTWPDEWKLGVKLVTPQFIDEVRRDLLISSDAAITTQPEYYSYWRRNDGKHILALESAATIAADLTITLHCYAAPPDKLTAASVLNVPWTQFPMLRYGLAWKLAEQYVPSRVREMQANYEDAKYTWRMRLTMPSRESIVRPVQPF